MPLKGGENMKGKESATAMSMLENYARRTQKQGETLGEAVARACSERPNYYRDYDNACKLEAERGEVQEHLQPQPEDSEVSDFDQERADVLDEIGKEAGPMTAGEYASGEGRKSRLVKVYDEMIKRGVRRQIAERTIG